MLTSASTDRTDGLDQTEEIRWIARLSDRMSARAYARHRRQARRCSAPGVPADNDRGRLPAQPSGERYCPARCQSANEPAAAASGVAQTVRRVSSTAAYDGAAGRGQPGPWLLPVTRVPRSLLIDASHDQLAQLDWRSGTCGSPYTVGTAGRPRRRRGDRCVGLCCRNANPSQARNGGPWPVWACRRVARAVEDGDRPARSRRCESRASLWLC